MNSQQIVSRKYYAQQSPRGFCNEIFVRVFASRAARDAWVGEHGNDGDVNSASCGARTCTSKEARSIIGYKGNEITESFNGMIDHLKGDPSDW